MMIQQHKILIDNFVEVYVGYKLGVISEKQILEFCEKGIIIRSNESRIIELRESYLKSLTCFTDKLIQFCNEDSVPLTYDYTGDLFNLPDEYFRIWELDALLSINKMNLSNEEKLDKVYELFYFFNFPKRWALNSIIKYSLRMRNIMYNDNELINNLNKYIGEELNYFLSRSKNIIK
ncbi:MAG TPA: DUF2247 family protein [Flavobacterium sp.]|nr:DUF2247 family protein [Flavobacterium sp.]